MQIADLNQTFLWGSLSVVLLNFALNNLKTLPKAIKEFLYSRVSITVEIPEGKYPFEAVKRFLSDQKYAFRTRNFSVSYKTDKLGNEVWQLPPAPGRHFFWYKGRLAAAFRSRRELQGGEKLAIFENIVLRFFWAKKGLIEEFLREADVEHSKKNGVVGVCMPTNWGQWESPVYIKARPLHTVILADGLSERIRLDVSEFLKSAEMYATRGIPHRRGYLFHGEPGNGKTSVIKALAAEFNKDIGIVSLNQSSDQKLMNLFMNLPKDTWVTLEDVDCLLDGRESSDTKVTFSGLLNALDGVASKEGYVLFMTTNHPELLDPALVRPGRVDERVHLGNATEEQAERYFGRFYSLPHQSELGREFGRKAGNGCHSMASLQDHLINHKTDPERAVASMT